MHATHMLLVLLFPQQRDRLRTVAKLQIPRMIFFIISIIAMIHAQVYPSSDVGRTDAARLGAPRPHVGFFFFEKKF
jgi:hypothetical protein